MASRAVKRIREPVLTETSDQTPPAGEPPKQLSEAAKRALAEAAERRKKREEDEKKKPKPPKEIDGQAGPEPTRYGDWERKGVTSDF